MEHELVGKLLYSRKPEGVVYRVESVDEYAFPSEQELTLRPVYVCKTEPGDPSGKLQRAEHNRANWMAGTGHQSIRWAALVSKVTERDVERMREHDQ